MCAVGWVFDRNPRKRRDIQTKTIPVFFVRVDGLIKYMGVHTMRASVSVCLSVSLFRHFVFFSMPLMFCRFRGDLPHARFQLDTNPNKSFHFISFRFLVRLQNSSNSFSLLTYSIQRLINSTIFRCRQYHIEITVILLLSFLF